MAPLGWLYGAAMYFRAILYRWGLLHSVELPVPVVVVGNVTVGGTGKTPLVGAIVEQLRASGRRPGIVTRGYGGSATHWPQQVGPSSDPHLVGDESVMLVRQTGQPVVAGPDRVAGARALINDYGCDVVVSDDGLQHLRLRRTVEIVVLDGERRFGNGRVLPAGPLREWPGRLRDVDLVLQRDGQATLDGFRLEPRALVNLERGETLATDHFSGVRVDALAGIGHPPRFFATLQNLGCEVEEYAYADHHEYSQSDLDQFGSRPLIMTEKDAVKCERLRCPADTFFLQVGVVLNDKGAGALARLLARID
jgi:tetraacyldisaccharide 4'-kinase